MKGSDGVIDQAISMGATPKAHGRVSLTLDALKGFEQHINFIVAPNDMGETLLQQYGFNYQAQPVEDSPKNRRSNTSSSSLVVSTTAEDTMKAVKWMQTRQVDLILFAGGDGTARDICAVIDDKIPVLGIPAGVKIHSSVFGITPGACADIIKAMINGQLVDIRDAEVRDLDEAAYRQDKVRTQYFGDMRVPQLGHFVQSVKQGGVEDESLVLMDIAATLQEDWDNEVIYLIGSGKTTRALMQSLDLNSTLLGIDIVKGHDVICQDATESDIWETLQKYRNIKLILSVMGGQGHIIGRGNQQLSPRVLRKIGKENVTLVSTKTKISQLEGRPLIIDSDDLELKKLWGGSIEILTGYDDRILYPVM